MLHNWGKKAKKADGTRRYNPDFAIATYYWFHVYCKSPEYARSIDEAVFGKSFEDYFKTRIPGKHYEEEPFNEVGVAASHQKTAKTSPAPASAPTRFTYSELHAEQDNPFHPERVPFTGRGDELAQLNAFLQTPHGNHDVSLWAVAGPSGSGKTRLVHHWLTTSTDMSEDQWEQLVLGTHYKPGEDDDPDYWKGWTPRYPTVMGVFGQLCH